MTTIQSISDKMQRRERPHKRLTLSAPQSIAETWLAPRLATLDLNKANIRLGIRVDDDPIDLITEKVDIRIFYGHDLYADHHVETLFSDALIAVASASFASRYQNDLEAVEDSGFIHTDWGRGFASSPDWGIALRGRRTIDRNVGLLVQSSSTALSHAKHGFGVALVPSLMAADDLAAKRVVQMDLAMTPLSGDYRVAYSRRLRSNPAVQIIADALRGVPARDV